MHAPTRSQHQRRLGPTRDAAPHVPPDERRWDPLRALLLLGALVFITLGGMAAASGAPWWALALVLIGLGQLVFGLW